MGSVNVATPSEDEPVPQVLMLVCIDSAIRDETRRARMEEVVLDLLDGYRGPQPVRFSFVDEDELLVTGAMAVGRPVDNSTIPSTRARRACPYLRASFAVGMWREEAYWGRELLRLCNWCGRGAQDTCEGGCRDSYMLRLRGHVDVPLCMECEGEHGRCRLCCEGSLTVPIRAFPPPVAARMAAAFDRRALDGGDRVQGILEREGPAAAARALAGLLREGEGRWGGDIGA